MPRTVERQKKNAYLCIISKAIDNFDLSGYCFECTESVGGGAVPGLDHEALDDFNCVTDDFHCKIKVV